MESVSLVSEGEGTGQETVEDVEAGKEEPDGEVTPNSTESDQPIKLEVGVVSEPPPAQQAELEEWKQKVSNLKLENKLMKREVNSLNEELSSLMLKVKEGSNSKAQYEGEMQTLREQVSRADHTLRQLRSHEEDLQASVEARDSQIEVLRTQLSAADRALSEANERVALSKREHERYVVWCLLEKFRVKILVKVRCSVFIELLPYSLSSDCYKM